MKINQCKILFEMSKKNINLVLVCQLCRKSGSIKSGFELSKTIFDPPVEEDFQ